ncbi:MAG: (Fe-S)-binding protein [Phycisphaerae bacterium]|jgi:L-lactate dehydrogenase complex protein LldE|nr:(Fe-S)-binding protein [Phycisphaerae bacterium]MDP7286928.1 (Fe-S)-binding protein [Phycisphaerae bacterium]
MKAAIFIPCLTEHMYPGSGISMVKVLRHAGVEIEYVDDQTCCGQPAFNAGYRREIIPIAERLIKLFAGKDYVIAPSGSCTAMVRVFYRELELNGALKDDLDELCGRIFEFCEFMVDVVKVGPLGGRFGHKVTYHDSCHLSRELGVVDQPRKLISDIADIDFVEMKDHDSCCGFGGMFSAKFGKLSTEMVARKCANIVDSGAEYVIGADAGCLMNIGGYLRKNNLAPQTMHIVDLLAKSLDL